MRKVKLTQGKVALVDDEDYERINKYRWHADYQCGYWRAARTIKKPNSKKQLMHRFIMSVPNGLDTDHRNHNGLDNRKYNLRICTRSQNIMNQLPHKKGKTTSKFKGVYWHKRNKKWCAQICLNGKKINLGYYAYEIEAAKIYDKKAQELFGEFAYSNFSLLEFQKYYKEE